MTNSCLKRDSAVMMSSRRPSAERYIVIHRIFKSPSPLYQRWLSSYAIVDGVTEAIRSLCTDRMAANAVIRHARQAIFRDCVKILHVVWNHQHDAVEFAFNNHFGEPFCDGFIRAYDSARGH